MKSFIPDRMASRSLDSLATLQTRAGATRMLTPPAHVNIEVTQRCNSHCTMCNRFFARKEEVEIGGDMSDAVFTAALKAVRYGSLVNLSGFGEPLLHPRFVEYARAVRRRGARLHFYTNGILLTPDISAELVRMRAEHVHVSIGAADPDTSFRLRGVPLEPVLENLRALHDYRQRVHSEYPRISLEAVATRSALRDLRGLLTLAHSLGALQVSLPHLVVHNQALREESPWNDVPEATVLIDEAVHHAKHIGVRLVPPSFTEQRGVCNLVFTDLTVAWSGVALLCHREAAIVGDLRQETAAEVWNGAPLRTLRERYQKRGPTAMTPMCKRCSSLLSEPSVYLDPPSYARKDAIVFAPSST